MIFADRAEHTPYYCDYNTATLSKLIYSGTEYKFRYLESWQNRIFGAYSDQTPNGDIDIRWSNLLPNLTVAAGKSTDCTFAAANQLYVPNDDPITGIRRMGRNNCFVYCENSINRLIHYPESTRPFSIMTVVDNVGAVTHYSVVDIGGIHFFFNEDYGFMQFDGNVWKPIGESVRDTFETIKLSAMPYIIGAHSQTTSEVVWTVPADSSATPNCLLYYNYRTGDWRRKDLAMRYVAHSRKVTDITTMTSLINLGYTKGSDFGNQTMQALLSEDKSVAYSNTDGKMYYDGTEADAGAAWDGYRLEPVMDFGDPLRQDTLREIWFNLSVTGDFQIYILHRSGDTVGETITSRWNILDTVSCNDPVNPVCYCNQTNRFHQILWGSSSNGQPFVVREIDFRYEPQRVY
jgi:hypothetical protein